jgi:DNA polymerase-3 subunit epsilon
MRQIVLDTETTGLDPQDGHKIIEIGCVELINRRLTGNDYHQYLQPDREIDIGAMEVHGITNERLADEPRFADVAADLLEYLRGAELIIHNAPFDMGFLDAELGHMHHADRIGKICKVTDSLTMARQMHPGQKNTLDALCKRYDVDNSQRDLHGALLDAQILADVYLAMTGGQAALSLDGNTDASGIRKKQEIKRVDSDRPRLRVIEPTEEERAAHNVRLDDIDKACGETSVWRKVEESLQ